MGREANMATETGITSDNSRGIDIAGLRQQAGQVTAAAAQISVIANEVAEGTESQVKSLDNAVSHPDSPQARAFRHVSEEIARQVSIEAMKPELVVLGKG